MVHDLIKAGLQQHQAGRLAEAKNIYEQVLASKPRHPDALHLLGVLTLQMGDAGRSATLIERALRVRPENPAFHANLAQAYFALRRVTDARAAFLRAATLDPGNPQPALGAANCLAMQGSFAEAERELRAVAQRHPGYALAWFNLGNAVREQGRPQEAADCYRRAIELDPTFADAHNNLGSVLHALERFEEAEPAYRQYLALQPDAVAGYCNLASVLIDRGRSADAAAVCQQGIELVHASTELPELHLMLGSALAHQGKFTAVLAAFRTAATIAPDNARALWAYCGALFETGNEREGLEWLERARELQPDSPEFRNSMAGFYLAAGDLQAGWREYEWRPARSRFVEKFPDLQLVREAPGSLAGRKIFLLREQGLGDELFFLRFAGALKARGAEITYRANAKLASMLGRVPALDRVITENDPLPAADLNMLVGDLPQVLGGADFPPPLALIALPQRLAEMKQRLAALGPPPYLGLTWRAGTAPEKQHGTVWVLHKDVPLEGLGTAVRGVSGTLLALQRNPKPGEIGELASHAGKPVHDLSAANEDLEEMLALLAVMDEYVGVSNTNTHLRAGAGRTARVLVPWPAEWRWMSTGETSPWFPGFRIYRQGPDGDWEAAVGRLRDDLLAAPGNR